MNVAAILPSRDEPATIAAVTRAVDTAFGTPDAVIVHADSSDSPATAERFALTPTRARKVGLTRLTRGKGAQIMAAAHRAEVMAADVVLIVDTDTRDPASSVYTALWTAVRDGAAVAIADYPRHWDEANLTNHLARPLIAAAARLDVPQPLAGDLALSGQALATAGRATRALPPALRSCAHGYGIDALLLLTAAGCGPVTSVRVDRPKRHAASFPHLGDIYHQAVPVLLHATATAARPRGVAAPGAPLYRIADRVIEPERLESMCRTLADLATYTAGYDDRPWPLPLADAWHAVHAGGSPSDAARGLWPHYTHRVRDWLTGARGESAAQRAERLCAAHVHLSTAIPCSGASS